MYVCMHISSGNLPVSLVKPTKILFRNLRVMSRTLHTVYEKKKKNIYIYITIYNVFLFKNYIYVYMCVCIIFLLYKKYYHSN